MNNPNEIVITPGKSSKNYWKDLWRFKELFYILSWRDIKVRYKQTTLGATWALIKPLLTLIIFTFVFGRVAQLNKNVKVPYSIIVLAGLLPWQFFSVSLSEAGNSLLSNANLITKVYFPRMIVSASSIITSLIDFGISLLLLIGLMIWFKYTPPLSLIALPFFIIITVFTSFGVGLFTTALNVKYRDFRYIIPFIIQFGIYISPVGFSTNEIVKRIGENYRDLLYINPMVGIIDGFRWCIIGDAMYWRGFMISLLVIIFFIIIGISYFRKTERSFVDNI